MSPIQDEKEMNARKKCGCDPVDGGFKAVPHLAFVIYTNYYTKLCNNQNLIYKLL